VIQSILEWKCIPFIIRASGDHSLDDYDGKPARTLPVNKCTLTPHEGEIVVRTIRHTCPKQITINPSYLEPWSPLDGCTVVVTSGLALGSVGTVKRRQAYDWLVTFTVDDVAQDLVFAEAELAILEDLKQ
jgi:hypothetical protein